VDLDGISRMAQGGAGSARAVEGSPMEQISLHNYLKPQPAGVRDQGNFLKQRTISFKAKMRDGGLYDSISEKSWNSFVCLGVLK
jgi:hypothetical protein